MKLQKQLSRKVGEKEYPKWVITIPPGDVEKLGWEEGENLKTVVNVDGLLVVKSKELSYEERRKENKKTYWYIPHETTVYTIGYEGRSLHEFIKMLKDHQIEQLVDVRETPLSRKNGFSKSSLSKALKAENIVYRHYRSLGTPKQLRYKLYEEKNYEEFFRNYTKWFSQPEAQEYLKDLEGLSQVRTTAIMCFERDVRFCHRSIIKKRLIEDGFKVVDL